MPMQTMPRYLCTVYNFLSSACDPGWFGSSCRYKCHCTNNQCDVDGKCTGGSTCVRGWFGHLCQYQDLTTVQPGTTSNNILTDGDDATCANVQTFNVSWDTAYEVQWLRVVLNGTDSSQTLQVNLKNSSGSVVACASQTLIRVYAQVTDIFCFNNITASQVLLDFKTNTNVCSVYISGGRNLALKQPTRQSSDYSDDKGTFYSTKAVDGNTDGDFYVGSSCTHTNSNPPGSWTVNFTQPRFVNRYVIYNRDSSRDRLKGFNLTSYSSSNRQLFTFKDTSSNNNVPVYYVTTATSSTPVSHVIISVGGILTLCEVETYGEYDCTSKTFGLECTNTCNCYDPTETCFVATGGCRSGCPMGYEGFGCAEDCEVTYYGQNCAQSCSTNCTNQLCNNVDGTCNSCVPGKQGKFCDQDCNATFYGQNCTQRCSTNCTNQLCNNVNGICNSCVPGKQGSFCDQVCDIHHYGENCRYNCSTNCTESTCNRTNGDCFSCIRGFQGPVCDKECNDTFFGDNCTEICSTNCLDQLCNNINGSCVSCIAGKKGEFCEQDCSVDRYGHNCNSACSANCTQSQCNATNGHCFKCLSGYQGDFCDQVCNDGQYGDGCFNTCSSLCVVHATKARCNYTDGACLIGCKVGFTRKDEECSLFFHALPVDQETPIAAIVVPILAVLIIAVLCIVGFLLWRRRRSNKGNAKDTSSTDGELTRMSESETVVLNGDGVKLQDTKRFSKPVAVVNAYCNNIEVNDREILVSQLHEFMQTHNIQYFSEEFYKIPSPQNVSSLVGLSVVNKSKNRYKNICSYDHSRVHLEINTKKNEGDYINASYIEGYNNEEKFIASQGPNEASINDFVRMLWEQKVDKVVMLTNLIEEGKEKCSRYWPTEGSVKFGDIKVKLATTHVFADYTFRKLELSKKNQTSHQFAQFHFTSWPDKGVPLTPWGLVDFEQRVALGSTSRPIVVHCSAGVGRTGTFIALRNVMREAEDTGRINCFETVAKLRQDRMLMVQIAEQYQFLHKAAQVAIVCMGTTVSSADIVDRIQKLSKLSLMKRSDMEEEFNAVSALSDDFSAVKDDNDTRCDENVYQNNVSENLTKNRYPSIVPSTPHRAVLSCESRDLDNYINAVLVPSFTKQKNQILTQLPMPNTVTDFWRLVAQYNVKLVVAFQALDEDQTLGQYLPANMTTPLDCGPYEIHTLPVKSESLWEEQQITVKVVKKSSVVLASNVINETQVTHIVSKSTDLNPKNLLKLLKYTRSNNVQAQGRVLYMCRNGAEYSGLACVLSLLLDRMDHDQSLTVPLVVGAIKCIRPQVIHSMEQYRCLYKVLERHNEVNTPYNNFANYSSAKPNPYVTPPSAEENIYANS